MYVTLEQQLEIEQEMVDGGIERFRKAMNQSVDSNRESRTLHGRTIIAHAVDSVAQEIEKRRQVKSNRDITRKKLEKIPSDVAAYLALTNLIDTLSKDTAVLTVAKRIGQGLEMEDKLRRWIEADREVAENVIRKANEKGETARAAGLTHKMNKDGYQHFKWQEVDRNHVGVNMIDAIIRATGMVEMKVMLKTRTKKTSYLVPTEKTQEWIKAFNEVAETWRPRYAPTILEPNKWTGIEGGGYYSELINLSIIRR